MSHGFDTTPKPAFLTAMRNQRWTVSGALSELIDNSFGFGRGRASHVKIIHNAKERTITVFDDGRGMDHIGRLFQLGNTIGRAPGDIGLYGSGGTWAVLWLPDVVEVWTLHDGFVSYDKIVWSRFISGDRFPVVSDERRKPSLTSTPAMLLNSGHGTLIKLHLRRERNFHVGNVQRDLAETFAPAPRLGCELVWINIGKSGAETETYLSEQISMPEECVRFDVVLETPSGDYLPVKGAIGVVDGLPYSKSFVSVGFGPRIIVKTRDCYCSEDGSEKFLGTGVVGWLDLGEGWQPYLSTTKDAMNDVPAWEKLMAFVFDKIRPLLERVENRELNIILNDMALQLENAFNAGDAPFLVDVRVGGEGREKELPVPVTTHSPNGPLSLFPSDRPGNDLDSKRPPRSVIAIVRVSDKELGGALCRLEVLGSFDLAIEINQDHEVVQDCLKSKPVNKMALMLLLTREIASAMIHHPVLLNRSFPPKVIRALEQQDERQKERLLARILVDRVHKEAA